MKNAKSMNTKEEKYSKMRKAGHIKQTNRILEKRYRLIGQFRKKGSCSNFVYFNYILLYIMNQKYFDSLYLVFLVFDDLIGQYYKTKVYNILHWGFFQLCIEYLW